MPSEKDFTKGNVKWQLIKFAIPIIIGNILMQLYNYTDSVIVGRYLGKEALAAVGTSGLFVFMFVAFIIGISMGSTILIAQYFGKKDFSNIRKVANSLYIFLIISSLFLTTIGILFSHKIMILLGLPEEVIPLSVDYLNVYLIGLIFLFIFNSLASILRGVGDSKSPLIFLLISSIINIILDIVFVVVFEWGVKGAAWATVISQALAVIFALYYTSKNNSSIPTNLLKLKFDKEIFLKSVKLGIPAGFQQLFTSLCMLAILSLVNSYGTDIIAGYTAATRIEAFIFIFPMNLSMALTSFTAQNYGASLTNRVRQGVKVTIRISLITSFVILILLSALALPLMKMFTQETEVVNAGVRYLYILGISYFMFCLMFCYMGAIRGFGNTIIPMFITLLSLWLIRFPLASILSNTPLKELGIWISAPISWGIGAISAYILYRRKMVENYLHERR